MKKTLCCFLAALLSAGYPNEPWAACSLVQSICSDGPSTKIISGVSVTRDCWSYTNQYLCDGGTVNECQQYIDKGCSQTNSACIEYDSTGACSLYEQHYQCATTSASKTVTSCNTNTFCVNDNGNQTCFDSSSSADSSFGSVVATLETTRELATYIDTNNLAIFEGEPNRCSKKMGIATCCTPSNGGDKMSNNSIALSAGMSIAGNAADVGSKYVYDALMSSGSGSLAQGMKSMVNYMGGDFKFDPSVSYMGIGVVYGGVPAAGSTALASTGGQATVDAINAAQAAQAAAAEAAAAAQQAQAVAQAAQASYEAAQAAAAASGSAADAAAAAQAAQAATTAADTAATAGVTAADASVTAAETGATAASATSGELTLFFSPMLFYLAIAMLVYQYLTSCDSDEQTLALKKGQKLCHAVGTYCSSNTAVGCMVEKETYCCFNSRLARIINEQGRPQLGMSWGTAQDPKCGGFTIADFQKLDFSKIDLSEFIAEITPTSVDTSSVTANAKSSVSTLSGTSSSSTSTSTSSYYAQ